MVFSTAGKQNTADTIALAVSRAQALNAPLIVSTYTGETGLTLVKAVKDAGADLSIIAVRGTFGFHIPGAFKMPAETEQQLLDAGVEIVSAAHALSGAERSISKKFGGAYPVEIIAQTLRMFGQGTKVAVECAIMAYDAGLLEPGTPVVSLGGTGTGVDTALVITPAGSAQVLDVKIHEVLCLPFEKKAVKA